MLKYLIIVKISNAMKCIDRGVEWIIKKWTEVPPSMPDPNPMDLLVLGQVFTTTCKLQLTNYNLDQSESQLLIKTIGDFMLDRSRVKARGSDVLIRNRHARLLKEEMETLENMMLDLSMIIGPDESGLVKAFFLTGSYSSMVGMTGIGERGDPTSKWGQMEETEYIKNNLAKYRMLSEISEKNSWVRAGIILSRMLKPNDPMVDYWVPTKSVYWESLFNEVKA